MQLIVEICVALVALKTRWNVPEANVHKWRFFQKEFETFSMSDRFSETPCLFKQLIHMGLKPIGSLRSVSGLRHENAYEKEESYFCLPH